MGTRRNKAIATQHANGLSAPLRQEQMWRRIHRADAWRSQGRKCKYCREPIPKNAVTADHKLAIRNGGTTSQGNIVAACVACNSAKGKMGETGFQKAIRNPLPSHPMSIWMAWSRLRIWSRVDRATTKLGKLVGVEV